MLRKNDKLVNGVKITPPVLLLSALLLTVTSCVYDNGDDAMAAGDGMAVTLNISTRSMTSTSKTYEVGSQWENYIDIAGGDYKIYFFTYNPQNTSDALSNNILIAEFTPREMTAAEGTTYTQYTLTGDVGDDIVAYSDFKVVVLANWGTYPTVTAGSTTIDDLVEGTNTTFSAEAFLSGVDSSHLIPFYGVREYSGVEWKDGWIIALEGDITLLRALAKVEVILEPSEDDQADISFSDVSIVNYNALGYCAPADVYLKSDYDHDGVWENDFVDGLHLVNNTNDPDEKAFTFRKTQDKEIDETTGEVTQYETWVAYVPEYDNMGEGYSYISLLTNIQLQLDDDEPYKIYFGNYTDGSTTAYGDAEDTDKSDRYNIYRNHLYRYRVTPGEYELLVSVNDWEAAFDNEWTFGNMDIGQVLDVGERFLIDNYWEYEVTSSEDMEVAITYNTADEGNVTNYSGAIEIPETVSYYGVNYTVTAIGEECFYGGTGITSVTIPSTINGIGDEAFSGCTGLETITCLATTPPKCGDDVFSGVSTESCTLYVPEESLSDYRTASPWSSFTNIEAVSDGQEP